MAHSRTVAFLLLSIALPSCAVEDTSDSSSSSSSSTTDSKCSTSFTSDVAGAEKIIGGAAFQGNELAQSVVPTAILSGIENIQLKLKAVGEPTGYLTLTIQGDSSGQPNINDVIGESILPALEISSTEAAFYTFTFKQKVIMQANVTYWIRVQAGYTDDGANHVVWMGSNKAEYTSGKALYEGATENSFEEALILDTSSATNKTDLTFKLGCTE